MSYIEICDKFDEVISYLTLTNEETINLSKFFISYKKITESFSLQLSKLSESIQISSNPDGNLNTLSMGLMSFKEHLDVVSDSNLKLAKSIQLDIIEPLDLFTEHFYSMHSETKTQGLNLQKQLKTSQEKLNKSKEEYYSFSKQLEKSSKKKLIEDQKFKDNEKSMNLNANLQEHYLDNYIKGILEVNQLWDEYDKIMPSIMMNLQQNEESQIHFIRNSIEKYVRHFQKSQSVIAENLEKLNEIILNVNSAIDIRVFVDMHKTNYSTPREQFVNYEEWNESINVREASDDDLESIIEILFTETDPQKISGIDSDTFTKLSEVISRIDDRKVFVDCLHQRIPSPQLHFQNLMQLAALIKELLNLMIRDFQYDASIFCEIIDAAVAFFSVVDGKKKFLSSLISPHCAWLDKKRWLQGIDYAISSKLIHTKNSQAKISGNSSSLYNSDRAEAQEKSDSVSAFALLSQFIFYLSKLNVPQHISTEIIIEAARLYKIDKEKAVILLSESQARSSLPLSLPNKTLPVDKTLSNFIGKVSKFLTVQEIIEIELVSKEFYHKLLKNKYKRLLVQKKGLGSISCLARRKAWTALLGIASYKLNYKTIATFINTSTNLLDELNDIIEMDVARSFQKHSDISAENLKNILKVYAFINKEVGYCQGMNYIAGTLFLVLQDEEFSCKALFIMIQRFAMKSLFTHNLRKLKKLFYILDRLIAIKLPELNESLKNAWVFSDNFSSAWFLTLFSSVFHSRFDIVVKIWDLFFISGWKGLFKVCLVILRRLTNRLIGNSFEDILFLVSGLANEQFLNDEFFEEAWEEKIDGRLLEAIKCEYKNIHLALDEY